MAAHPKITIEEWSEKWAEDFRALELVYRTFLGEMISGIHHVGSTSVPGLPAKPIVDIDLVIDKHELHLPVREKLEEMGYEFAGDLGIKDRMVFKRRTEQAPLDGSDRLWPLHNLYVCHKDNIALHNHLSFRDYLRENPEKVKAYGELKKKLAKVHPYDIDAYVEKKTAFVIEGLRAKGFSEETLNSIVDQNRAIGR